MRTRPESASHLFFRVSFAAALAVAGLLSNSEGQSSAPSQSPGGPAAAPISSFLNLDTTRPAANPQTSPSSATIVAPGITAPSGYRLSVDDQVVVEVFGEDDLRTAARVNSEGAVSLPLLGSVKLAGLTLNDAAARLTEL